MQTRAAAKESSSHATQSFFSVQPARAPSFFESQSADLVQRKCSACQAEEYKLQRQAETSPEEEEESLQSKPDSAPVQPKLDITPPDDPQEREADQVADRVMRMPAPDAGQGIAGSAGIDGGSINRMTDGAALEDESVQRKCDECQIDAPSGEEQTEDKEPDLTKDDDQGPVNPKSESGRPTPVPDDLHLALRSSRGNGQPMPAPLEASMEGRFGEDFSSVRVHANSASAAMAKSINAQAFTYGSDIFFNPSRYDPGSTAGQTLLAHELTHVIQQKGAHPLKRKIQRSEEHDRIGNWAHGEIQKRLRSRDDHLITEAGIPGATRRGAKINNAGFADLYKSDGSVISGVQAEIRGKDDLTNTTKYTYKNFLGPTSKRRMNIQSESNIYIGPTIGKDKKKTWDFTHNFPKNFQVGEIKPLFLTEFTISMAYHGSAALQVDKYLRGFEAFVKQAHRDMGSPVPDSISGKPLDLETENKIPDSINYKKFEQEHGRKDEHTILKNKFVKPEETTQRVWIYQIKPGEYYYFLVTHPYTKKEFPQQFDKQLQRLDPLLKALRDKHPKMGTALKREPGTQSAHAPALAISRKRGKRVQAKDDAWTQTGKDWEQKRKAWVRGDDSATPKPKQFLKKQAKGVEKKAKVDKELKLTPSQAEKERAKKVKDIRFWSSFKGRVFGTLYFRFRKVFVKIEELFSKIKAKFQKHRENAAKHQTSPGVFDGWKKTATKAIIRLAAEIFKDMVSIAFTGFMNCINAIIEGITGKYVKAIEEEVGEQAEKIEPVCCEIMVFKHRFDAEVEKHEKLITEFTETVHKIREWQAILSDVEVAVRIGVQVVSCGLPPGLGCLWGLVAQLGIEAGLSLLARTNYFDDHIARPAARAIMDAIVGDKLHNLMVDALEATPLKDHLAGLAPCARRVSSGGGSGNGIGGHLDKLDPNDPVNAKARAEWEAAHKAEILKDLHEVFEKGDKTPLTEAEIQKLVEALKEMMKDGKKSPEDLKKMLQAARNPKTGKLDLDKAHTQVSSGEVPEDQSKERKIDYDKAEKSNPYYQKRIGWDPTTFIKQPGIKADSKEFTDAVYDMQEANGAHPDGIAGPATTVKFYQENKLPKDKTYAQAVMVGEEEAQARAAIKEEENLKKATDEFRKDEKVRAAMAVPFSSEDALKADLASLDWATFVPGETRLTKVKGRAVIAVMTSGERRFGAYFHFVESESKGVKRPRFLDTSRFFALDDIPTMSLLDYEVTSADGKSTPLFVGVVPQEKGAFFDWDPPFFAMFVEFQ